MRIVSKWFAGILLVVLTFSVNACQPVLKDVRPEASVPSQTTVAAEKQKSAPKQKHAPKPEAVDPEALKKERVQLIPAITRHMRTGAVAEAQAPMERVIEIDALLGHKYYARKLSIFTDFEKFFRKKNEWSAIGHVRQLKAVFMAKAKGQDHYSVIDMRLSAAHAARLAQLTPDQLRDLERIVALKKEVNRLVKEKQYTKALGVRDEILRILEQTLGRTHRRYAETLNRQAVLHGRAGNDEIEAGLYQEAYDLYREHVSPDHPEINWMLYNLGLVAKRKGDLARSADLYRRSAQVLYNAYGADNKNYKSRLGSLSGVLKVTADLKEEQGDSAGAHALWLELRDVRKKRLGDDHWSVTEAKWRLNDLALMRNFSPEQVQALVQVKKMDKEASQLRKDKLYTEAIAKRLAILQIQTQLLGPQHPKNAEQLNSIGVLYTWVDDLEKSGDYFARAYAMRISTLGDVHPDVTYSLDNMGWWHRKMGESERAAQYFGKAADLQKKIYGKKNKNYQRNLKDMIAELKKTARVKDKAIDFEALAVLQNELVRRQGEKWGKAHWETRDAKLAAAHAERLAALGPDRRAQIAQARTLEQEAGALYDQKVYDRAALKREQALNIRRLILGDDHPEYAEHLNRLAVLYSRMSQYPRSALLSQKALDLQLKARGKNNPDTALMYHNLGYLYEQTEDYERTVSHYREAAQIRKILFGDKHKKYRRSLRALGEALADQANQARKRRRWKAAQAAYQERLAAITELYGEAYWQVASVRWNIVYVDKLSRLDKGGLEAITRIGNLHDQAKQLRKENKLKEALKTARSALAAVKALLGTDVIWRANLLNLMGDIGYDLKTYVKAAENHSLALEIRKAIFGEDHPDMALSQNQLALCLEKQADLQRATALFRASARTYKSARGLEHRNTKTVMGNLARALGALAEEQIAAHAFDNAKQSLDELIQVQIDLEGKDHWRVTDARKRQRDADLLAGFTPEQLARLESAQKNHQSARDYEKKKKLSAAIAAMRKSLAAKQALLGPEHPEVARAAVYLGDLLDMAGEVMVALPNYRQALRIRQKVFGGAHPETLVSLERLGLLYASLNRYAPAAALIETALAQHKLISGAEHADTLRIQRLVAQINAAAAAPESDVQIFSYIQNRRKTQANRLYDKATRLSKKGRIVDAIAVLKKDIDITRRIQGAAAMDLGYSYLRLADLLESQGNFAAAQEARERVLQIFSRHYPADDWHIVDARLAHINAQKRSVLSTAAKKRLERADALFKIAGQHKKEGRLEQALTLITEGTQTYEEILGADHKNAINGFFWQAHVLKQMGRADAALNAYEVTAARRRKLLGPRHPDLVDALNRLAWHLRNMGRDLQARPHLEEVLAIEQSVSGPKSIAAAAAMNELGNLLLGLEDFQRSRTYFESALAIRRQKHGDKHRDVANSLNGLAIVLQNTGEPAAAKVHFKEALVIWKKVLGANHPRVATGLSNLGNLLADAGSLDEARTLFEEALAIRQKNYGRQHLSVAASLSLLGLLHAQQDEFERAVQLYREAAAIKATLLGKEHPDFRRTMTNLTYVLDVWAERYHEQGDYAAALDLYTEILDLKTDLFGQDHWETVNARLSLASARRVAAMNPEERKRLGHIQQETARAGTARGSSNYAEAIAILKASIPTYKELLGLHDRETMATQTLLALNYGLNGQYQKAETAYQEAMAAMAKGLGKNHPDYSLPLVFYGRMLRDKGEYRRAETVFLQLADIYGTVQGKAHADYRTTLMEIIQLYEQMARQAEERQQYAEARKVLQKMIIRIRERWGSEHWQLENARSSLERIEHLMSMGTDQSRQVAEAQTLIKSAQDDYGKGQLQTALQAATEAWQLREVLLGRDAEPTIDALRLVAEIEGAMEEYAASRKHYETALAAALKRYGEFHPKISSILNALGLGLRKAREYEAAHKHLERALGVKKRVYGADHLETSTTHNNLALVLKELDRKPEALEHYQRALSIRRKVLGSNHAWTALVMENMSHLYQEMGSFGAAKKLMQEALQVRTRLSGPEHPNTARALNNFGFLLEESGDYQAALEKYEAALAIYEKAYGSEHADAAFMRRNLGKLFIRMEAYRKAETYLTQALEIYRRIYGEKHAETALTLNNLGGFHRRLGEYPKAEAHFQASLDINEDVLGPDHPSTIAGMVSLASLFQTMGNYEKSRNVFERILQLEEQKYGPQDHRVAARLNAIGNRLREMGDYAAAQAHIERALSIYESLYGKSHILIAYTLELLGDVLYYLGDYPRARQHLEQALALDRALYGNEHRKTAVALHYLGFIVQAMGDDTGARPLWEESLAIMRKTKGNDNPDLVTDLNNLGVLLNSTEPDTARAYYQEALTILKKTLTREDPVTPGRLLQIAYQYERMDQYEAARPFYEQALDLRRKNLGQNHLYVAHVFDDLGDLEWRLENFEAALAHFSEALAIYERSLGRNHIRTAATMIRAAKARYRRGEKAQARDLWEKALTVYTTMRGEDHPQTAGRFDSIGQFLMGRGDYETARPYLIKALALKRKIFGDEHPDTITARMTLGHLLAAEGQNDAAWEHLSDGAMQFARLINQRLAANPEGEHLSMVAYRRYVFEALLSLAEDAPEVAQRHGSELLANVLAWKAVSGQALRARQEAVVMQREPEAAALYDRLRRNRREQVTQQLRITAHRKTDGQTDPLAELKREQKEIERRIAEKVKGYALWRQNLQAGPEEIGRHLPDGSALVEFVKYRHFDFRSFGTGFGEPRYAAVVFSRPMRTGWFTDYARAKAESSYHRMPLLIHFHADWAAPSLQLEKEVLRDPEVIKTLNRRFVTVKVNTDQENELAKQFKIRSIPSLVAVDADGKILKTISGRRPKERLISELDELKLTQKASEAYQFVSLGEAQALEQTVQEWRAAVDAETYSAEIEARLRRRVWEPLARVLPSHARTLLLAPDGQLSLLPYEAIRLKDERFLVEKYQISYVANGRDLMPRPLKTGGDPGPAVIVSNPNYDDLDAPEQPGRQDTGDAENEQVLAAVQQRSSALALNLAPFVNLPGFVREARAVADTWHDARPDQPLHLLLGPEAAEAKIEGLKQPRLLYFITHGFFFPDLKPLYFANSGDGGRGGTDAAADNRGIAVVAERLETQRPKVYSEDPLLRSGLALTGANRWQQRTARNVPDGLLTASEVQNLDLLGTELVVLSACETGLGEVAVGEGVMGLRRAFQMAGADTILASLWKVPDTETVWLMSRFFQQWLKGNPKARSLRDAQLHLIQKLRNDPDALRRRALPKWWSGFILHGRPD